MNVKNADKKLNILFTDMMRGAVYHATFGWRKNAPITIALYAQTDLKAPMSFIICRKINLTAREKESFGDVKIISIKKREK